MSDEQIREILIQRKKEARRRANRAAVLEVVGDLLGWSSLIVICFMLSVIGG